MRHTTLILAIATLTVLAPMGLSDGVAPTATINGDFELHTENPASEQLTGSPADECIGIGHQVLYGEASVQHDLIDDEDPEAAVDRISQDPEGEALYTSGYDHCVWSEEEGYDYVWLNPVEKTKDSAAQWSTQPDTSPTTFGDNDGDGDREATISSGGAGHNMWQAYPNAHEAFTGDFAAFELDVEAGEINPGALVQISMSPNPLDEQSDRTFEADCRLSFSGSLLLANMDSDGHVSVDPIDASYSSHYDGCPSVQDWEDADDDEKRAILGQLRIVQMSFWSFNRGVTEDPGCGCTIQIDNVSITNPASLAESALNGNVQADPVLLE